MLRLRVGAIVNVQIYTLNCRKQMHIKVKAYGTQMNSFLTYAAKLLLTE